MKKHRLPIRNPPPKKATPLSRGQRAKSPLDKGENVCEANEGDLPLSNNNMIYMLIMLLAPNMSLTDCRSNKQIPNF